jgi:hypothetical protein
MSHVPTLGLFSQTIYKHVKSHGKVPLMNIVINEI